MKTWTKVSWAAAMAPVLLALAGCGENNESRVKVEGGATTSPDAAKTSDDALKQGATVEANKAGAAAKGYPGAKR